MSKHTLNLHSSTVPYSLKEEEEGGIDFYSLWEALRRQVPLIAAITCVITTGAFIKAILDKPAYESELELLTESVSTENQVASSANPQTLSNTEAAVSVAVDEVKIKVLKSPKVLGEILKKLNKKYPDFTYKELILGLTLETNRTGQILTVKYRGNNPQLVLDVLNTTAQVYLDYSLEAQQVNVKRGIAFLEEQLPQMRSRVTKFQDKLQSLRQKNNLIDPGTQAEQLTVQVNEFQRERLSIQAQLIEARILESSLNKELSGKSYQIAGVSASTNPRYQELLNQLLAIDTQLAKDSALLLENSPEIQLLKEQRQRLLPLIKLEAGRIEKLMNSRVKELEIKEKALDKTIRDLNQEIQILSVVTRQYTDIQQELQIANGNLSQFMTKREALRIDAAQKQTPWELLTPPNLPKADSANVKRNVALGLFLGLCTGVGLALALNKLNNILYTVQEIKSVSELPLLGIIPFSKALSASLSLDSDSLTMGQSGEGDIKMRLSEGGKPQIVLMSSFREAFHALHTSIRLLDPDNPVRSLVVSSSVPEEGKSTVAFNLGQVAAATGRRVLIVDTDLRSPQLHRQIGLSNLIGLSDLFTREDLDLGTVIQSSTLEDNLFILTTGYLPPEPVRLLGAEKMQRLMAKLHQSFDLVIYDAPCILGLADVQLLSTNTDGVILVAGLGKLKYSMLKQSLEQLKVARTNVLGIVANMASNSGYGLQDHYQNEKPKERQTSLYNESSLGQSQ